MRYLGDGLDIDVPADTDMLGTAQIAELWGLSRAYVVNKLTKRPDFPRPAVNLSQKTRRWAWADLDHFAKATTRKGHR